MSQKVIKWSKEGPILIIIKKRFSVVKYRSGFDFTVLYPLSCLLPQKQVHIGPSYFGFGIPPM